MSDTPAHVQKFTHSYMVHYPAHAPRAHDPHKRDFDAWKQQRRDAGTYYCDFAHDHRGGDTSECDTRHPLEAHHKVVELAMLNEVDFTLLEADYPGVSDPDAAGAWIDSDANLTLLCVTEGSPVLMSDGSTLPIEDVQVDDCVVGLDGHSYPVIATRRKRYRGEVVTFGTAAFTPEHRLLGHGGWFPSAEILRQVRMHGPEVIALRGEKHEIAPAVICPVSVEMMHAFARQEFSADPSFHNQNMFHYQPGPVCYPDISLGSEIRSPFPGVPLRQSVKRRQTTPVRTVATLDRSAVPAMEWRVADFTKPEMGWFTVMPSTALFTGWVHDLSVAHSKSFIAGGIVAHNCTYHHRGPMGVHCASYSDFGSEAYVRNLITGVS